jgi:cytochrome P450
MSYNTVLRVVTESRAAEFPVKNANDMNDREKETHRDRRFLFSGTIEHRRVRKYDYECQALMELVTGRNQSTWNESFSSATSSTTKSIINWKMLEFET